MKKKLKDLLKLTNFEFERMSKFIFGLMGFVLVINLAGYLYVPFRYMSKVNQFMTSNSASLEQAVESFEIFSFAGMLNTFWIAGPIAVGISGLLFYAVFTWYREWLGKNTFAYRLLTLPIARMNIYFSKLMTIFIGIFSLLATQMLSFAIGYPIVSMIIKRPLLSDLSLLEAVNTNVTFQFLFPFRPWFFLAINGIGLVFLMVLFTFILMERSYGIKGIIMGVVYAAISFMTVLFPFSIPNIFRNYYILYESEMILIGIIAFTIVGMISIFVSSHLLNKKITV